jgi:HK97 family phage portal protein
MRRIFPSILKNIIPSRKKSSGVTSHRIFPIQPGSFLEQLFSDQEAISFHQAMKYYQHNSSIATAVNKIAVACEQISPVLKNPDGSIEYKHDCLLKIKSPNFFETYKEFIGQLIRHYLLTNNSFVSLIGNISSPPLQLYAVKPQNVNIYQDRLDGYPNYYNISTVSPGRGKYNREENRMRVRYLDGNLLELYHIMGFSAKDINTQGDSPLEAIALEIKQQIAGKTHNVSLLNQGGRLSLVVTFKGESPSEQEFEEREQRIYETFSGSNNAGKIAVLAGEDVSISEFGKTNKDMDFVNLDEMAKNVIFLKFGVPLPLVSLDASTYNNIELATFDFFENTVLPVFSTVMDGLSKVLMPRYKLDYPDYKLTYDNTSIPVIMRQMLNEIELRKKINIESINELRDTIGKNDVEGGETIYQPATLVPLGMEEEPTLTDDEIAKLAKEYRDTEYNV